MSAISAGGRQQRRVRREFHLLGDRVERGAAAAAVRRRSGAGNHRQLAVGAVERERHLHDRLMLPGSGVRVSMRIGNTHACGNRPSHALEDPHAGCQTEDRPLAFVGRLRPEFFDRRTAVRARRETPRPDDGRVEDAGIGGGDGPFRRKLT
jgi:hypothetical protein